MKLNLRKLYSLTLIITTAIFMQGCGLSGLFLGEKAWRYNWDDCTRVQTYLTWAIYAGWIFDMLIGFLVLRRWQSPAKYAVFLLYCGSSWFIAMQAHWFTDAPATCEAKMNRH